MRFLPIVARELRVAARRHGTYAIRLLAAAAALTVTLWLCLLPTLGQPPSALGKSLFTALSIMAFAYCLLIGPFLTADCISSEKRDGTLGLLFLTDLRGFDVVLGRSEERRVGKGCWWGGAQGQGRRRRQASMARCGSI